MICKADGRDYDVEGASDEMIVREESVTCRGSSGNCGCSSAGSRSRRVCRLGRRRRRRRSGQRRRLELSWLW